MNKNLTSLTDEELEEAREEAEHLFFGQDTYNHEKAIHHYHHLKEIWHEEQRRYTRR